MGNQTIKVENIIKDGESPKMMYNQEILSFIRFGKEIKVSPKSHACFNKEGYEIKIYVPSVTVCIGIGNDHTAELVMSKDAWDALQSGIEASITTTEEFKTRYVYKKEIE